jgi:hypothetical protein
MSNQQLLDYIKKELSLNVPKEKIRSALLGADWTLQDIESAFVQIELADQTALISPDKTIDANGSKTAELAHNKIVWLVFVLFGISTIGAILNKNDRSFEILTFAWFIAAGLGILTALYYIIIKSLLRRHISYVKTGFILLLIVGVVGFGSCIFNLSLSNF